MGKLRKLRKLRKVCLMVSVNLVILVLLLVLAELGYRVYRDGVTGTWSRLWDPGPAPRSSSGANSKMIHDDELGYRLNPGYEGVNERSVRGPSIAVPRPRGWSRVVMLGDSLQWDVPSFVDLWQYSLRPDQRLDLINASTPGYTAYQEVTFYKRFLTDTRPDLVVWTYCLNDNHRFMHVIDQHGFMLLTPEAKAHLEASSRWDLLINRSYLLSLARLVHVTHAASPTPAKGRYRWQNQAGFAVAWRDYSWSLYEEQLLRLQAMLERGSTRLVVLVIPYEPQLLLQSDPDQAYVQKPQRKMAALCKKHGVMCLDLYPVFAGAYAKGQKLFYDGIHLNRGGHRLVHEQLVAFLARRRLLPADLVRQPAKDLPTSRVNRIAPVPAR